MGLNLEFLEIIPTKPEPLQEFIDKLGAEEESFRYYKSRSLDVLQQHRYTCLATYEGKSIGYGHLDLEEGVTWLGIVVVREYQGKGVAKQIMTALLNKAEKLGLSYIQLSVDITNDKAIKLYERFGFKKISRRNGYIIFKKFL